MCVDVSAGPDPFGPVRDSASLRNVLESLQLTDQNGEAFSMRQLQGHIVLLNFIFTQCSTVCPIQTQRLQQLRQQLMRAHPALNVRFVSVTLTPYWDTPKVLAAYGQRHNIPDDGTWRLVTGEPAEIDDMMRALGMKTKVASVESGNQLSHLTTYYLFDARGNLKKQYEGVNTPEKHLTQEILSLNRAQE